MSDIFREVEEEVRRERFEQLWKKYGDYVLAGAAVLVIGAAAFQLWRYYDNRERLRASEEFAAAEEVASAGAIDKAGEAFGRLADTAPGGYAALARLAHADSLLAMDKTDEALALYGKIAEGDDAALSGIARIRIAWVLVETSPKSKIETELAPLTSETSGWRSLAREIIAYSDYRAGNLDLAQKEFRSISKDKQAPDGVRARSSVMADFIAAGGEANYGHVPEPQVTKSAPKTPLPSDTQGSPKK